MTNILNYFKKRWIRILQPIEITLESKLAARLTLTQDSNFRRLGTPIGTISIMLNTVIKLAGGLLFFLPFPYLVAGLSLPYSTLLLFWAAFLFLSISLPFWCGFLFFILHRCRF